jgi:hypothetical protein
VFRILIVLFWVSLIVGTYVTGNVLGNWVVCLLALFFFVRSRRRHEPLRPADPSRSPLTGAPTSPGRAPLRGIRATSIAGRDYGSRHWR